VASDVTIRPGGPSDEERLLAVFRAAGQAAWAHILPVDDLANGPGPRRWTAALLDPPPRSRMLVAERGGEIVGFARVCESADDDAGETTGELDAFYTHPGVWGAGIGRRLLAEAVDALAGFSFTEATLWTAEANHRPRRVYERAGWQLDGRSRQRTLFGAAFVEVRYRIRLGGSHDPGQPGQGSDPLEGGRGLALRTAASRDARPSHRSLARRAKLRPR
jgi:GNAT superfamily N-acetyltransferase